MEPFILPVIAVPLLVNSTTYDVDLLQTSSCDDDSCDDYSCDDDDYSSSDHSPGRSESSDSSDSCNSDVTITDPLVCTQKELTEPFDANNSTTLSCKQSYGDPPGTNHSSSPLLSSVTSSGSSDYSGYYMGYSKQLENIIFSLSHDFRFCHRMFGHSSSVVYGAIDKRTQELVAIKIYSRKRSRKRDGLGRAGDPIEVKVLSKLFDVPFCQQLRRCYKFGQEIVIISPIYREDSIRKTIWGRLDMIQKFMFQLLSALEQIHVRKIIYRDMKLSNIMWDATSEQLTLIDFDLSTFNRGEHRRYAGTEGFEAPEIIARLAYDEKIDIYSTGVVFGQLIFKCHEMDVTPKRVQDWKRHCKKEEHRAHLAKQLFLKMVSINPCDRPSVVQLLRSPFFVKIHDQNK